MSDSLKFQHFEILTKPDGSPLELGQGAMGTTYKAVDTNLQSTVVIKVINPQYVTDPIVKRRFLQEAKAMAKVRHPNVASIFHLSECPNGVFFAMEFCDGPTLQEYVETNGAMPVGDSLLICQQVCSALQAAHERRLVHRDLKPSNLILVKDDQKKVSVKVIDFGLARAFGDDVTQLDLTGGGFVGTPSYASPEQLKGNQDLDTRADIYSLGVTLWFMLCGSPTFNGSHFEVMARHVNEEPPWEILPPLPDSALAIVHRMLRKSPDERYQTPMELWEDIQRCLAEEALTETTGFSEGTTLDTDKFETIEEVGSGQAGKVFSGKDSIVGGRIAIKFVKKEVLEVPGAVRDIRRQLRHLNSIKQHPNILKIIAFDDSDEEREARVIMEWVQGTNLEKVLRARQKMSLPEALPIIQQIAQGIDFALDNQLRFLELEPHQILVQASLDPQGRINESKLLVQPFGQWPECTVKLNPLRVVPDEDDNPTTFSGAAFDLNEAETIVPQPDLEPEGTAPSIYNFCGLVHRLLGGAAPDTGNAKPFVPLDALSDAGNEILESGRRANHRGPAGKRCAEVLASLCRSEGIPVPDTFSVESLSGRSRTSSSFGSTKGKGSTFEQQRNAIDLKLRRLELERLAAEQEGKLLGREEEVEQQRRDVEEERERLEREKAELEQKIEDERREVEEGKQMLRKERSELRRQMEAQAAALASEKQQQAIAFQQFVDERKKWEQEQKEAQEQHIREQREARERLRLEEGKISEEIDARRQTLEKAAEELDARRARLEEDLRRKANEQTADIQAERERIEEAQRNLEARLSRQTLDLDEAQHQVESAREELRVRTEALERESAERAAAMEAEMERQRGELKTARNELDAERKALQAARENQELEFEQRWQREKARLDKVASEIEARQLSLNRAGENETVAEHDQQSLERQESLRQEQLLLLEEDRKALEAERRQLREQQRREDERREQREIEDRERITAREHELDALKIRLEQEAAERQQAQQKTRVEFEALLAKEREGLAQERERIEKAKQEGGVQAQVLEQERSELKNLRTELAELASNLDRREAAERARLEQQKEQELARIGQSEADLTSRRADLEREQEEIESRIEAEKHRLAEIEDERKSEEQKFREQERDYADRAARFAVVESNAERKLSDLRSKIVELEAEEAKSKQRHKVRMRKIAAAVVVLVAVGVFAAFKGKVIWDEIWDPGVTIWLAHAESAANFSRDQQWTLLLERVAQTHQKLDKPKYTNKRTEILPVLMKDADKAVDGVLDKLDEGQSLSDAKSTSVLRSLGYVITKEPNAKYWLLSAKLQLRRAANDGGATAPDALATYKVVCLNSQSLREPLKDDLNMLIDSLASIFAAERAIKRSPELIEILGQLTGNTSSQSPNIQLLLAQLKADEARKAGRFADAIQHCIDAGQEPNANKTWEIALRKELEFILEDLSDATNLDIDSLTVNLRSAAELFRTRSPYIFLAENSTEGKQVEFYVLAERLESPKDLEPAEKVRDDANKHKAAMWFGYFAAAAPEEIPPDIRQKYRRRVEQSAAEEDPLGLYLMARLHLEEKVPDEKTKNFAIKKKHLEEAIDLARAAKNKEYPDAELIEGTAMLSLAILQKSSEDIETARRVLKGLAESKKYREANYELFRSYMPGYDLYLIAVSEIHDLVDDGKLLVVVALVGDKLRIRIFDATGKKVIDKPEDQLVQGQELTTLKRMLNSKPFPEESSLAQKEKQQIIKSAASIASHTLEHVWDTENAAKALQQGSGLGSINCMFELAKWYYIGQAPIPRDLTEARNLHLTLAKDHNLPDSKEWLKKYESENPDDSDWIEKNQIHWK